MLTKSFIWISGFALLCQGAILSQEKKSTDTAVTSKPPMENHWLKQFTLADGVSLELLAKEPDLVTPVGMDVDKNGEMYVVVNHTHHRPENYQGPAHDQILVFDPVTLKSRVFYEGTSATMHLKLGDDGWVYVVERAQISRLRDTDQDGKADQREVILRLITVNDYPHNGLGDIRWHPDGGMIVSLGENFGEPWDFVGSDRNVISGTGEGGVFYCSRNGAGLRRIAKGFWNPFGVEVTPEGDIFVAENDPGSRPPCRLIHVVEGADYGFQWNYGRDPFHPFVGWDGELRGTLGMVYPVGEGPSSIRQLGGGMMVPSWSQHKIEYFPLTRQGAGFTASRELLIQGPEDFRPVTIVRKDEHTFFFTDWVSGSYPVHGQGRLWKMTIDPAKAKWLKPAMDPQTPEASLATNWRNGKSLPKRAELFEQSRSSDKVLADAAFTGLAKTSARMTPEDWRKLSDADKLSALVALRRGNMQNTVIVESAWNLGEESEAIRFECLRWIADAKLMAFEDRVHSMLRKKELPYFLFEAALATLNTLQGNSRAGLLNLDVLWKKFQDPELSDLSRAYLLRLMPDVNNKLKVEDLKEYLKSSNLELQLEAVRKLRGRNVESVWKEFATLLENPQTSKAMKLEILQAFALSSNASFLEKIVPFLKSDDFDLQQEARRTLRFTELDKNSPEGEFKVSTDRPQKSDVEAWIQRLEKVPGTRNLENGKRIFFHPKVALCASCHRYDGRGGVIGPDLSLIAWQGDAKSLLSSILDPNAEVAPQFYPSKLELVNGETFFGMLLRSSHIDVYRDLSGKEKVFKKDEVRTREELKMSLMTPNLVDAMTDEELADLWAFLKHQKN